MKAIRTKIPTPTMIHRPLRVTGLFSPLAIDPKKFMAPDFRVNCRFGDVPEAAPRRNRPTTLDSVRRKKIRND
jgi:hypothetical protein